MKKIFGVSDVHGMLNEFLKTLSYWNPDDSELVLLGDYVDRGPNSKEVLYKILELKEKYPNIVTVLLGNHDQKFLDALFGDEDDKIEYLSWGGLTTLQSFAKGTPIEGSKDLNELIINIISNHGAIVDMLLNQTKLYHIEGKVLFTHAGFQSLFDDISKTKEHEFNHIRHHYRSKNTTGFVNVFGHTITRLIHPNIENNNIWINFDKNYIGIDGAVSFGGQLNSILINDNGEIQHVYVVENEKIQNS